MLTNGFVSDKHSDTASQRLAKPLQSGGSRTPRAAWALEVQATIDVTGVGEALKRTGRQLWTLH